jgi:hypothetical protein
MVRHTEPADEESTDDPTAIAEAAVELSARDDVSTKSPVRMAFAEASNDEDTVCVRFAADRDGGVSFDISPASLYEDWYRPDHIIAEHFGVEAAIDDALTVLREDVDLRNVRESRVGAFRFDRDTGDVVDVSIYGVDVDGEDVTVARMMSCFEADDE